MKRFSVLLSLFLLPFMIQAQNDKSEFPEDVPGSLTFDLGFNFFDQVNTLDPTDPDETDWGIGWFGSRTARIAYNYEMQILKSGFTFNPGIGFSDERYAFSSDITVVDSVGSNRIEVIQLQETLGNPQTSPIDVQYSKLSGVYLDVPLELRWHANKEDLQRSFKVAVGIRGGLRLGGKTKIRYTNIDGNKRTLKSKESYDLRQFRVGVHGRIGVGSFSFYYFQNLTKLFEDDKGPIQYDDTTPWQIGITYEIL